MKQRVFTMQDQLAFATVSGDHNLLHVDPVAARRLMFGGPIVHGIHLLLWALDAWLEEAETPVALTSLTANFRRPLGVGQEVQHRPSEDRDAQVKIDLFDADGPLAKISFAWIARGSDWPKSPQLNSPLHGECRPRTTDNLRGAVGMLPLELDIEKASHLLPHVARLLPRLQIALLASTSRLVGMECPGLHSTYAALSLRFEPTKAAEWLRFEVTNFDERFGRVMMTVACPGMEGTIKAYLRPAPTEQPRCDALRPLVDADEFVGQRALVVGGSRGLGEVVAKLLALGGADVRLSYCRGRQEAEAVASEILSHGGRAVAFPYDVLAPHDTLTRACETWKPTHLYYFATPFIAAGSKQAFSADRFQKLSAYYVTGFAELIQRTRAISADLRYVFYPSTVYIDELPETMAEYILAKCAGETLCDFLQQHFRGLVFYKPRLPRMGTDQTASFVALENAETVTTMLSHLRIMGRQS